jgi:hypothetical protein
MKKLLITMLLALCGYGASAQSNGLELSSKWDNNGNGVVEVIKSDGNIYTVIIEFIDVKNFQVSKFSRKLAEGRGQLQILKPVDNEQSSSFRYSYRYFSGGVNPKNVDTEFVYRLPYSLSESREPHELYYFNEKYKVGDDNVENWKAFQFYMSRGDTIYATRKGEVIRVVDSFEPLVDVGEVSMNTETNQVLVEHPDGTIARYNVLERGSITVKPGEKVFPGTPLGLAGSLDGERYQMQFSLYYQTDNLDDINSLSDYKLVYNYVDPVFNTTAGEVTLQEGKLYKPVCTEEMITREMTKREIKSRASR